MRPKREPELVPGKVTVTGLISGWCRAGNVAHERAKRASAEFGDKVVFQEIDGLDPDVMWEWGRTDGLFIDGKEASWGPPPSYEKIHKKISKRVKRLKSV